MASQLTYFSDESSDSEIENSESGKAINRNRYDWSLVQNFDSEEEVLNFTKQEWAVYNTKVLTTGKVVYLYCRAGGKKCPGKMKIEVNLDRKCLLQFNGGTHFHFQKTLTEQTKKEILAISNNGVQKANSILRILKDNGKTVPAKQVLVNFLAYHKRKNIDRIAFLTDLEKFCSDNEDVPENEDEFYVIKHELNEEGPTFRVAMSTKRLLKLSTLGQNIATDATYKMNYNGYPMFVFGVIDKRKKFHPTCIMTATGETIEDYAFGFSALREGVAWAHGLVLQPKVLISDSAEAIHNGFQEIFGEDYLRVNCWAHTNRAYEKRLLCINESGLREELNADIHKLQLCSSPAIFQTACTLWIQKWQGHANKDVKSFITYFEKEWINNSSGWYEGVAPGHPSTNNALESINPLLDTLHCRSLMPDTDV